MDLYNSKGWRNRRKLAEINSYGNADDERQAIRAERARLYAEAEAENARAAEANAASLAVEECTCPCCGTGTVPVPKAAAMLEAWHNYNFHGYKPSKGMIASLAAIARGETTPPGCPTITATYGMLLPHPSAVRSAPVPVAAETVEPPKPSRAKGKQDADQFLADGALVEL